MAGARLRVVVYSVPPKVDADGLGEHARSGARALSDLAGYGGGQWGYDEAVGAFVAVTSWTGGEAITMATGHLERLQRERGEHGLVVTAVVNLDLLATPLSWPSEQWAAMSSRRSPTWIRVALYTMDTAVDAATADAMRADLVERTDETVFLLRGAEGFRVGYWGMDPATGTLAAITYWTDRDAITANIGYLDAVHAVRATHGAVTGPVLNLQMLHADVPTPHDA